MLYSIGYQKMTDPMELVDALKRYGITHLADVRSKPYGRKHLFNRKKLEEILPLHGIKYQWCGEHLGGFAEIKDSAIETLATWQQDKTACLMCMEANYLDCHRHTEIAQRLKALDVGVGHIVFESSGETRIEWSYVERSDGIEPSGEAGR